MPRGGYRPNAGRPKGTAKAKEGPTPAKAPAKGALKRRPIPASALAAAAQEVASIVNCAAFSAPTRFETAANFLRAVLNNEVIPTDDQMKAAIALLPFTDPKVVEVGSKKSAALEAAKVAASSRFAPSAPPKLAIDNTRKPPG